jgi:copper chaperone CopZ
MNFKYFHTLMIMFLSFISIGVFGQDTQDKIQTDVQTQSVKTVKLKVTGLTCSGDLKDIQAEVTKIKGVISCLPAKKPSATTSFEVKYDPALISEKEIRAAIEGTAGCSDPDSRPYKVKQ